MGRRIFGIVMLLFIAFMTPYISAPSIFGDTRSDFIVEGCEANGRSIEAGECSGDGNYYCKSNGPGIQSTLQNTLLEATACSFGNLSISPGDQQCCPSGYECVAGTLVCNQRTLPCNAEVDQTSCEGVIGCFWINESSGYCADRPSDFSCSVYAASNSCEEDVWNIGSEGFGTEVCGGSVSYNGSTYVVPYSSCECKWDTISSSCKLNYDILPDLYRFNAIPTDLDTFTCQKDFQVGLCIDGEQEINWTADQVNKQGIFDVTPFTPHLNISLSTNCINSALLPPTTRSCGEKVVRLPGISILSILISLAALLVFYIYKEKNL